MTRSITTILFLLCSILLHAQGDKAKQLPIGVFDSGTGGLTILESIITLDAFNNETGALGSDGKLDFKNESFQYLADQANMPYGNYAAVGKTELLKEHILKNASFFLNDKYNLPKRDEYKSLTKPTVKFIVIACNTATAYALKDVQKFVGEQSNIPVVGVIDAGSRAALDYQRKNITGTIGVFATAGTVASNGYPKTLRAMAMLSNMEEPMIISQGGVGLAESIDRDNSFFTESGTKIRDDYKGPSLKNQNFRIDTQLMNAYAFNKNDNKLLCEYDQSGKCLEMQLNDPGNYVRYHLVSLLEKMKRERYSKPLNTLILGCTHYPYMKDTITTVLHELYNYTKDGELVYRDYLSKNVELIDPGVETAKEVYLEMKKHNLFSKTSNQLKNQFFISVPNTSLKEVKLDQNGWFTYDYKYGRNEGSRKEFVKYVPFNTQNIPMAVYSRFKILLPHVYDIIKVEVPSLD